MVVGQRSVPYADLIRNKGVSERELKVALLHPGEGRPGKKGSRVAIGQTKSGQHLRVIYVSDPEPDSIFAITAYELKGEALEACRRRRRER